MTGYGRSDFAIGSEVFSVEIKSLNHRYIDIYLRSLERFSPLENRIREEIRKKFSRGAFSVYVNVVSTDTPSMKVNIPVAKAYMDAATELKKELGIKGEEVDIPLLLRLKDIFSFERKAIDAESDWTFLKDGLYRAFGQLEEWRVKEGGALREDLISRLLTIESMAASVEARAPGIIEDYRNRLKTEIEKLIAGKVDEARILQEAAIFAERTDVSEELSRLKSHIDMFRKYLKFNEPIGKRLDFLCQELGRETNTVGSKSNDIQITQTVIEMKGELEKVREQVQNIE